MASQFKTGKSNAGQPSMGAHRGMKIKTPYGKDSSDYSGSAKHERTGKCAGGPMDLSHSLKGSTATQRGR